MKEFLKRHKLFFVIIFILGLFAFIVVFLFFYILGEIFSTDFYKKDGKVYVTGFDMHEEVDDADYETFEVLKVPFFKDKDSIYYLHYKIEGADIETFKILGHDYSKDKNSIYSKMSKLKYPYDLETFEVLNYDYTKDKNGIYCYSKIIENANMKNFEVFDDSSYAKDDKNVYYLGKKINNADPNTFKVLHEFAPTYAKDKNYCFHGDEIAPMPECDEYENENKKIIIF